jgi:hypothetical protein
VGSCPINLSKLLFLQHSTYHHETENEITAADYGGRILHSWMQKDIGIGENPGKHSFWLLYTTLMCRWLVQNSQSGNTWKHRACRVTNFPDYMGLALFMSRLYRHA